MFRIANVPPQSSSGALHIVFQRGELISNMRSREPCMIEDQELNSMGWQERQRLFLGFWQDRACYAIEIEPAHELDAMQFQRGNLYQVLGRVDERLFALAGRASQLLAWERDHQFCGRCGQAMVMDIEERAMRCEPCSTINYPRISPCIIVLITKGEQMLLARNANFPRPMYSTLAGFIEAGESAEETLIREVREEVGVEVKNIRYFQSQSWPFPSQLMLGYFAEYDSGDIVCDQTEIADAQWFDPGQLPMIPPVSSISGQLIQSHLNSLR